jgi:hypothetical protein
MLVENLRPLRIQENKIRLSDFQAMDKILNWPRLVE